MRKFTWRRQELAERCSKQEPHVHICMTTVGYRKISPACGAQTLNLLFDDTDPYTIMKTMKAAENPEKAHELATQCFGLEHADAIKKFVKETADSDIIVNCEAGVSRSPAVVLALRRMYGGDPEEVFEQACPNMYVAGLLEKVLRLEPLVPGQLFFPDKEPSVKIKEIKMKHGIYAFEDSVDKAYSFYWLGEAVSDVEFNLRLWERMKVRIVSDEILESQ